MKLTNIGLPTRFALVDGLSGWGILVWGVEEKFGGRAVVEGDYETRIILGLCGEAYDLK